MTTSPVTPREEALALLGDRAGAGHPMMPDTARLLVHEILGGDEGRDPLELDAIADAMVEICGRYC